MKFVCFKPNFKTFHLVGPENKAQTEDWLSSAERLHRLLLFFSTYAPPVSVTQTHHTFPWMMLQVDCKSVALPLVA